MGILIAVVWVAASLILLVWVASTRAKAGVVFMFLAHFLAMISLAAALITTGRLLLRV
jgi:hypothetical protein